MNKFDQIIGYDNIKQELMRYCDTINNPDKYARLGVKMPRGVMLEGEPGIGKTLLAECFMKECNCNSYTIRRNLPEIEFIKHITDTFKEAKENAPAVILLDDLDKFANEDLKHRDAPEYVAVQAGIDECSKSNVFILATANETDCLPESLLREGRFDKIINMEYPTGETAKEILKYYLATKNLTDEIDVEEIAFLMSGENCAAMEEVINDAGMYAAYAGKDAVEQEDLREACIRYYVGTSDERTIKKKRLTKSVAIHEAGHILVTEYYRPNSVKLSSITGFDSQMGGVTIPCKAEDNMSEEAFFAEVSICLAGKAATRVFLDETDTGCSRDIRSARDMAERYISRLCAKGFEASVSLMDMSNYAKDYRDKEVASLLSEVYMADVELLLEQKEVLIAMANALLEKPILTYKEIRSIIRNVGWSESMPYIRTKKKSGICKAG